MERSPNRGSQGIRSGAIAVSVVVGVLAAVVLAFVLWVHSEYTECFGSFPSQAEADSAMEAVDDAGFEADANDAATAASRDGRISVTFHSGETGTDADEFRAAFRDALKSNRGKSGHGKDGCLERGPIQ